MTWSTWSGFRLERVRTSATIVAPSSTAGVSLSWPPNVPIAVRSGTETTMSSPLVGDWMHRWWPQTDQGASPRYLALDAAHDDATHEIALHGEENQHARQAHQHRRRHEQVL